MAVGGAGHVPSPGLAVPVPAAVRGVRGFTRGVVRWHRDLVPGEPLGEPYLLRVHAPGHGYDTAGDPRGPEGEKRRGNGLADVSCCERGCEHGIPLVTVDRGKSPPTSLKHLIEQNES